MQPLLKPHCMIYTGYMGLQTGPCVPGPPQWGSRCEVSPLTSPPSFMRNILTCKTRCEGHHSHLLCTAEPREGGGRVIRGKRGNQGLLPAGLVHINSDAFWIHPDQMTNHFNRMGAAILLLDLSEITCCVGTSFGSGFFQRTVIINSKTSARLRPGLV